MTTPIDPRVRTILENQAYALDIYDVRSPSAMFNAAAALNRKRRPQGFRYVDYKGRTAYNFLIVAGKDGAEDEFLGGWISQTDKYGLDTEAAVSEVTDCELPSLVHRFTRAVERSYRSRRSSSYQSGYLLGILPVVLIGGVVAGVYGVSLDKSSAWALIPILGLLYGLTWVASHVHLHFAWKKDETAGALRALSAA
ncbi:MAG TPA: hypothetical protein VEA36_00770 [Candidatus Paceibacterota bacterium]|nr:hypothetical protein [Candidatus Paceibacterota bacterium]